jgi:hypothetical protein
LQKQKDYSAPMFALNELDSGALEFVAAKKITEEETTSGGAASAEFCENGRQIERWSGVDGVGRRGSDGAGVG